MDERILLFLALVRDGISLGSGGPETRKAVENLSVPELEDLLALASLHHLDALVGSLLYPLRKDWEKAPLLRRRVLSTVAQDARRGQALVELTEAFGEIPYALVKGAVLRSLYPAPELRISMDEDILVEDFGPAEAVLEAQGFRLLSVGAQDGPVHTWEKEELKVELHRDLLEDWRFPGVDAHWFAGCLSRREVVETPYGPMATLGPQDHFLYLMLHFYKHFLTGGLGLRQVCDLLLFGGHYAINWPDFYDRLREARLEVLFSNLLELGRLYLGLGANIPSPEKVPKPDCEALLLDILAAGAYGSSTLERKRSSRMTLAAAEAGRASGGGAVHALFPGRAAMAAQYPYLQKQPWLLPVAWGSRIFGYLRSGGGKGASVSVDLGKERVALLQKYKIID